MTYPPSDMGWAQLWMTVSDVFHIRGRGTVVTGMLEGNGLLSPGDTAVCDGMRWSVSAIEQFRAVLTAAEPGSQIGVLLGKGPAGDVLLGRTLQFETRAPMQPQFTPVEPRKKRWRR